MTFQNVLIKSGAFAAALLASAPVGAMLCSTGPDVAIPQGSGSATPGAAATTTIVVPAAFNAEIDDMDFQLEIDHTYVGDLIVTLESPAGTVVTLLDRPGRFTPFGTFGCFRNNINVTLDDEAATTVESQCAAADPTIAGTRSPNGSLSDFDGEDYAGTWTVSVTDNAGQDLGTLIASGTCLDVTTVPVVLSAFSTKRRGASIVANWQTSSEAFNLGFDLWGQVEDEWVRLNHRFISSREFDSVEPQNYRRKIRVNDLDAEITAIGLSSVSSSGQEEFYGPFEIGAEYGEETVPRKIDWADQRRRYNQSMLDAGYIQINGRWVYANKKRLKRLEKLQQRFPDTVLDIVESGVYRVTYEELLARGIDLKGMPINKLAVTRQGTGVPRIVENANRPARKFGPGGKIIFYAEGPDDNTRRYVDSARYQISLDPGKVVSAPYVGGQDGESGSAPVAVHNQTIRIGQPKTYSFLLPGDHPWFDSTIRAFRATGSKTVAFAVPETAQLDLPSTLEVSLVGGVQFTRIDVDGDGEPEPHHHFEIYLNRDQFADPIHVGYANGFEPIELLIDTRNQLKHGSNDVEIVLIPDNGFNYDAAYFVEAGLTYKVPAAMTGDYLSFDWQDTAAVSVQDQLESLQAVYTFDASRNFSQHSFDRNAAGQVEIDSPLAPQLQESIGFWLAGVNGYLSPRDIFNAPAVDQADLDLTGIDYVIVADPSLIGQDLQRFVDRHVELGRTVKVVNTRHIFDRYSDGLVVPQAVTAYLSEQADSSAYQYVLLVGGHTYNYRAYNTAEENRPINLIPSYYRRGDGLARQIPTAVPFVDFDADGSPEKAIGRWPVRNQQELKYVIDKTLAWHADGSLKDSKSALFIAGAKESLNEFTGSAERVYAALGNDVNPWQEPTRVYMDTIYEDDAIPPEAKITEARSRLVDAINQGKALTVFNGHGSPTSWGNQSLVTPDVAESFSNQASPSLMVPLACYTSYYETPNVSSLAELLMSANPHGAVAISSASLLSRTSDNENFARRLFIEMSENGLDLGSAVLKVKRDLHAIGDRHQFMIYNWTTLGDPALGFDLPAVSEPLEPDQPKQ